MYFFYNQVKNVIGLYNVHVLAIEDIVGRTLRRSIELQFSDRVEEVEALHDLIVRETNGICKGFRLKKHKKTIEWPTALLYCKDQVEELINGKINTKSYVLEGEEEFQSAVITQQELWDLLVKENWIRDQQIDSDKWKLKAVKNDINHLPEELESKKTILIDYLKQHDGQEFIPQVFRKLFQLPETIDDSRLVQQFTELDLIVPMETCHGYLAINSIDSLPENLEKFGSILAALIHQTGESESIVVYRENLTLPRDKLEGGRQIWNYLIEQGVIKEPTVIFPLDKSSDNIESRLKEIEKTIQTHSDEINAIFSKNSPTTNAEENARQLVGAVTGSAGQLKTLPVVSASFRKLGEYFTSGRYPPELDHFEDHELNGVLVLKEYKSWWDWRAFTVAIIGILQIVIGVAVNIVSAGVLSPIGNAIIFEGVNDILFAVQAGLTGTFSWSAYGKQKLISVSISILTAGMATYLSWSSKAVQIGYAGFKARLGLKMLMEAGKQILVKVAKTARSALISLGVQKLLGFIKKLIIDNISKWLRESIAGAFALGTVNRLAEAMKKIWNATGGNLAESQRLIRSTVETTSSHQTQSTWFQTLSSRSSQLGNSMMRAFSDSSRELGVREETMVGLSKAQLADNNSTGNDTIDLAIDAAKMAKQAVDIAETTNTVIKWIDQVRKGVEIASLVTHAPVYIDNLSHQLEQQAHSIEMKKKDEAEAASSEANHQEEFNQFQLKMRERVEKEVLNHVIDKVNSIWIQPLLERKIEGAFKRADKATSQLITSFFSNSDDLNNLQGLNNQRTRVEQQQHHEEQSATAAATQESVPVEDYAGQVASIGQSDRPASLLEIQQIADALGTSIQLEDGSGTFTSNSRDGSNTFTFRPNGKTSSKVIRLQVSRNESDGKLHASYVDNEGQVRQVNPSGENRCVYDACAEATGCSTTEAFIENIKSHAINNERAMYMNNPILFSIIIIFNH